MLGQDTEPEDLDHQWFRAVYDRHWRQVYAYCLHHTGSETVAEEILQEIFMSIWERRHTLDTNKPLEAYLIASAKYKVLDYFRAQAIRKKHLQSLNPIPDWDTTTEETLAARELSEQVDLLVSAMPPQSQLVYQMSRKQGMTNRQIADTLVISEKTVEYHLTRALALLRRHLLPVR